MEYYLYDVARAFKLFGRDVRNLSNNRQISLWAKQLVTRKANRKGLSNCAMKYTREGKPFFSSHPDFHFSISHTHDKIAIAFSSHSIGIDIESLREYKPLLVKRFFHPFEYDFLENIKNKEEQNQAFSRLWTLKEAYVKCTGTGIANYFDKFYITFKMIGSVPLISIGDNSTRVKLSSFYQDNFYISIAEEY